MYYYDLKFITESIVQNQIYYFCPILRPVNNLIMHKHFYKYIKYHIMDIETMKSINKCVLFDNVVMNVPLTLYLLYCIISYHSSSLDSVNVLLFIKCIPKYIIILLLIISYNFIFIISITCFAALCSLYITKKFL